MTRALKNLLRLIPAFFRWWTGELVVLIPSTLRQRLTAGGERLLLELGPGGRRLYRARGRKVAPLDESRLAAGKASVTLVMPRAEIATRPTQLPTAAEENLHEVVGFEMDRLSPFSREEVYYACRIAGRNAKAGRLLVDVLLVPRAKVDALLATLRSEGFAIGAVDVASGEPGRTLGLNLLPQKIRTKPSRLARGFAGILTVAAVVLLAVALQIPLQRKAEHAAALEARVAEERARVMVLQGLREEIAALDVPQSSLQDLKRDTPLTLALLDQVTRMLPDDTWLSQLNLNDDRLELAGFSPSSSKLIALFEQAPQFAETAFRAPVTQDARLGLERFSLSIRVTPEVAR